MPETAAVELQPVAARGLDVPQGALPTWLCAADICRPPPSRFPLPLPPARQGGPLLHAAPGGTQGDVRALVGRGEEGGQALLGAPAVWQWMVSPQQLCLRWRRAVCYEPPGLRLPCEMRPPCYMPVAFSQVGTKLLAADVKIASRLLGKVVHGKTLTR